MEGAVVSYGDGVAKALVGKLGNLLSNEYRHLSGVRAGIVDLKDEVAIMNALLRMLAEADEAAISHFAREWMKQVRELTYDAEDCIDLFGRRVSCVPDGSGAASVLAAAWHWLVTLPARHRLASDIQALRSRALAISERRARYGVDGQALRPSAPFVPVTVVASASAVTLGAAHDPSQFVGIEGQVKSLSERLESDQDREPGDKMLTVFSIVGFGGLGKTTLAMQVCRKLTKEFVCQAIVSVSQAFDGGKDMSGLLKRILHQVLRTEEQKGIQQQAAVASQVDSMNVDTLSTTLKDQLKDKRYLVVIDDVWTIPAWDAIRSKLPENMLNSRVIVTTRIESVAKACSTPSATENNNVHKIKPLDIGDSEKLFVDRVFGPGANCPDGLKEIMTLILKKCGGLPLAIVSIASLLASYKSPGSIAMWERICNSIGSQLEINATLEGMRQILTLSYSHLPHHLKNCMLYLSIFPEDYVIKKKRILYRWVAEGLVVKKRGLTLMEVAEAFFDELISRNMIHATANIRYDGAVRACHVHDMMLEVVVTKSLEENFVTLVGNQCGGMTLPYDRVRRISIQDDDPWHTIQGMDVQHIRSLSTFQAGHQKLLDRLDEFTLLRVLDLEGCEDVRDAHMKHICGLFLLRFLSLRDTDVSIVPNQIETLQHLQTLNLYNTAIEKLPQSVTNLQKLEHLYFRNKNNWLTLWRLPRGLQKMKALRLARKVDLINDVQVALEVGELAQLRDIEFVLCCDDQQVLEELANSLSRIKSLRTLKVAEDHPPFSGKMNFLLHLKEPPPLLQSLRICGAIQKLPDWIESLKHLATIKLRRLHLNGDQIYGVLYKLPNLMRIDIEFGTCSSDELVARAGYRFPALKDLRVLPYIAGDNPELIRFEKGSMEKLEKLMGYFDRNETRSLEGLEYLERLKEVTLIMGTRNNEAIDRIVIKVKSGIQSRPNVEDIKLIVQYY